MSPNIKVRVIKTPCEVSGLLLYYATDKIYNKKIDIIDGKRYNLPMKVHIEQSLMGFGSSGTSPSIEVNKSVSNMCISNPFQTSSTIQISNNTIRFDRNLLTIKQYKEGSGSDKFCGEESFTPPYIYTHRPELEPSQEAKDKTPKKDVFQPQFRRISYNKTISCSDIKAGYRCRQTTIDCSRLAVVPRICPDPTTTYKYLTRPRNTPRLSNQSSSLNINTLQVNVPIRFLHESRHAMTVVVRSSK